MPAAASDALQFVFTRCHSDALHHRLRPQSNCSAEMAHEHRIQITKLIDDCYKPTTVSGQTPGYEQIWGGTVPMFDIWKRGVSPFDSLREQVRNALCRVCSVCSAMDSERHDTRRDAMQDTNFDFHLCVQ